MLFGACLCRDDHGINMKFVGHVVKTSALYIAIENNLIVENLSNQWPWCHYMNFFNQHEFWLLHFDSMNIAMNSGIFCYGNYHF